MCGICAIISKSEYISFEIYDCLVALQHRGQDAAAELRGGGRPAARVGGRPRRAQRGGGRVGRGRGRGGGDVRPHRSVGHERGDGHEPPV